MRSRPGRTVLTALGIAIGIAALVAVVGISTSSRADLLAELDQLGTNLLQVRAGQDLFGEAAVLPEEAPGMVRRIGPVERTAAVAQLSAAVRRSDHIDELETGAISMMTAELDLLDTLGATVREGRWLDAGTSHTPTVVLGSTAARRLGITSLTGSPLVWIGDQWFAVIGILDPVPLLANLDSSAFVGAAAAEDLLGWDGKVSTLYVRTPPSSVDDVRSVLAATVNPLAPNEVEVSRPTDALAARSAVDRELTALLLGLGGVALLVGGIGIANVMVISVLERRSEIGVRRAIGATRRHIRVQFLTEAAILASIGGAGGALLGSVVTAGYSRMQEVPFSMPPVAIAGGVGAALGVGLLAGLLPAGRAARLAPAEALRL
ncbi:MAG TPA: ABC transporter permease [Ilumatobacteraceae bacterium]|nr:ABC transporter permease [Ilumatobacteraceae bacterium]